MNELASLKRKARVLYIKALDFDDLDCSRALAEHIRPSIHTARIKLVKLWERVKELDSSAPDCPLSGDDL